MKYKEIISLSEAEKEKKINEAKLELLKLRAQISQGTVLKSPGQVKQFKKTISKIKTAKSKEVKNNG
ncbi:MAG: 50S ribosomal protein L29 [Candidatus Woesearchaeota archaeon]